MFRSLFYSAWNEVKKLIGGASVQTLEQKPKRERVRIEKFGAIAYFGMNSDNESPYWQGSLPDKILAKVVFNKDGSASLYIAPRNQDDRNKILRDYLNYVFRPETESAIPNGNHISGEMYFLSHIEP